MSARYAWIIDTDHLADPTYPEGSYSNAKGLTGPSDAPKDLLHFLTGRAELTGTIGAAGHQQCEITRFQMYDDDGERYYDGRYAGYLPDHGPDSETAFGPLQDFGTPNAGATDIRYRNSKTGKWETL